jgi:ankyrin repeat protein
MLIDYGASKHEALHSAARYGWPGMVKLLLARGVGVNHWITGWATPLHAAAMYGRLRAVKVLLEHGADVRAVAEMPNSEDLGTPQQMAAYFQHDEVAKLLSRVEPKGVQWPVFLGSAEVRL